MLVGSMALAMTACGNVDSGSASSDAGDGGAESLEAPVDSAGGADGEAAGSETVSGQEGGQTEAGGSKALQPFDETVTIKMGHGLNPNATFPEGENMEDNHYLQWLKRDLNIAVEYDWICSNTDFGQKMNLCIASNTLPDAMNVGQTQYLAMMKYDQIQPLTEAFEEYASDRLKQYVRSGGEALMEAISSNGEMYAIPAPSLTASGVNTMWIRQDWLDELNLEVPRTVEEVFDVAKKFVEANMGGENTVGIIGPASGDQLIGVGGNRWGLDPIFGAYQSYPEYWLKGDNGEITYGSVQPQTKDALAKLAEMYKAGVIDPEVFVRNDALEPVTAGRAGIFFGPWWCGYTVDSVTLDGSQEWAAYAAPLAGDGKFYSPMADPTTSYVCVRKGYEHPEAAIQIINYLIAYEQDWINEGKDANMSISEVYPLFNVYDNADEIEYSYEWLTKFSMGEVKKEDVDLTGRKLLQGDLDAIEVLKLEPKDDFSLEYWDLDNELADANLPRLVSIMVGMKPLMEEGYEPIYNAFNGQTDTMAAKWVNLQKLEEETFAKIVLGQAPIDEFDNFVDKWYAEGGKEILEEVTAAVNK